MDYNYDAWEAKLKPLQNNLAQDAQEDPDDRPFNGCMFETFGKELEHVLNVTNGKVAGLGPGHVWTRLTCGAIAAGYHLANREAYFITELPCDSPDDYVLFELKWSWRGVSIGLEFSA